MSTIQGTSIKCDYCGEQTPFYTHEIGKNTMDTIRLNERFVQIIITHPRHRMSILKDTCSNCAPK